MSMWPTALFPTHQYPTISNLFILSFFHLIFLISTGTELFIVGYPQLSAYQVAETLRSLIAAFIVLLIIGTELILKNPD